MSIRCSNANNQTLTGLAPPNMHVQTLPQRRLSTRNVVRDEPEPEPEPERYRGRRDSRERRDSRDRRQRRDSQDQRQTYESNPEWRAHPDLHPEQRRHTEW